MRNVEICLMVYIYEHCNNALRQWSNDFADMEVKVGYSKSYMSHSLMDLMNKGLVKFLYVRGKSYANGDKYVREYYLTEKGIDLLEKTKKAP